MGDLYDAAFRTILNDSGWLILPLINEAFGERYTGGEMIDFLPNEHFIAQQDGADKKRITDTNFVVHGAVDRKYHWECQSTPDSRMLVRLFEYDAQIALGQGEEAGGTLTAEFPRSAVLYLRGAGAAPETYRYVIKTPGGTVEYGIPVMKIQSYTLDDIFSKELYLLLPFYIFTFEKDFGEYEADAGKLEALRAEYRGMAGRLEALEGSGGIRGYDKYLLARLTGEVARELAKKYGHVVQGVDEAMGGPLIELEGRKYLEEGLQKGRMEGLREGERNGLQKGRREGEQKGRREGEQKGRREGERAGLQKGRMEALAASVRNLMRSMGLTVEKAFDALAVPQEERTLLAPLL